MSMQLLNKAKEIIKKNIQCALCGLFNTQNRTGDFMDCLYDQDGLIININYYWHYFEVFGLTDEEFADLLNFYRTLVQETLKGENI